jgi:hypothetical protein
MKASQPQLFFRSYNKRIASGGPSECLECNEYAPLLTKIHLLMLKIRARQIVRSLLA